MSSIKVTLERALAINESIAATKMSTVNNLFAFLENKIEINDDMKGYFEEFKATLKDDLDVEAYYTYYAAKLLKAKAKMEKKPRAKKDAFKK